MTVGRLQAGVAELEITGQAGMRLAAELNERMAQAVRTPLMAKALVLTNGEASLVLVTLDLFGLQASAVERLVKAISERCGLAPEAVWVVCSHTRAAPVTTEVVGCGGVEAEYLQRILAEVPEVVARAQDALAPAAVGLGQALLPHLMYNHRLMTRNMKAISAWLGVPRDEVLAPEGPVDASLTVLVVRDERGRPFCLVWSCAGDNRFSRDEEISADLPYYVQVGLDERLGRHVPCLYLPGCGGNISFTYGLAETADALASGVMAVQLETPCDPAVRLGSLWRRVVLPIRDYSQFWSEADVELKAPQVLETYRKEVEYLQQEGAYAVPARVQAARVGRFGLVGLPGMPFVELGLQVQQASPFQKTLVVGNTGGDVGWVIPRAAFETGGFEAWPARSAKVGPGGGEFLAEQAVVLLRLLHNLK